MIDSRISLVIFTVLFIVIISFTANQFNVDAISCSDPANFVDKPDANLTSIDSLSQSANSIVDVFYGCSSTNSIINGVFLSLQAAITLVIIYIVWPFS